MHRAEPARAFRCVACSVRRAEDAARASWLMVGAKVAWFGSCEGFFLFSKKEN
jgi:hypothetical protein